MKNNSYTDALTNWAINKIKTEYQDDVALLIAVPHQSFNGDGHGLCFDYFIPATERGMELSRTFILDGVGHDLYPRTWERMERTADLMDWASVCLADGEIKYSRSQEDSAHFAALQQQLKDNLGNPGFVYRAALAKLDSAMEIYRTMVFESSSMLTKMRVAAAHIFYNLKMGVAYMNGTYVNSSTAWQGGTLTELETFKDMPDNFAAYYQGIISVDSGSEPDDLHSAGEELKNLAYLSILSMRRFLASRRPIKEDSHKSPNYEMLAELYQEISLWWHRLYAYCAANNKDGAFAEAVRLQTELNEMTEEFGLEAMDLLQAYAPSDLSELSNHAKEIEQRILGAIRENGVKLHKYDTIEEFLANE